MPVEKQSGVGSPTPGLYLVFKIMNCSLWTCSKSLMPYSSQFINNYKCLLWPWPGPAFLLFFLSLTTHSSHNGHLRCFHVLAALNSAAMNIGIHVSLKNYGCILYMARSGISGSYDSSVFVVLPYSFP